MRTAVSLIADHSLYDSGHSFWLGTFGPDILSLGVSVRALISASSLDFGTLCYRKDVSCFSAAGSRCRSANTRRSRYSRWPTSSFSSVGFPLLEKTVSTHIFFRRRYVRPWIKCPLAAVMPRLIYSHAGRLLILITAISISQTWQHNNSLFQSSSSFGMAQLPHDIIIAAFICQNRIVHER